MPFNWIAAAGAAFSAYGAIKGGQDTESYYSRLAEIQRINAEVEKANAAMDIAGKEARAEWALDAAEIDLENARFTTEYKTIVSENERRFNEYMAALTRRQAAETADISTGAYVGEKKIIAETEELKKEDAQRAYDEKMDLIRHQVAESVARGGKGGFNVNAGSFMSALRDTTAAGNLSATEARESAFRGAEINTESGILSADTTYKSRMLAAEGMEGTAQRYDLGGKINLEEIKLAQALYGGAQADYGIAEEQYNFMMDQIPTLQSLNEQRYGTNLAQANLSEQQGKNARTSSYYGAAGSLLSGFAKAFYTKG